MTREEKIELINHLKYDRSIGANYTVTDEDVDEIIKALKQEPMQVELEGDGYADGFLVYDYGKCPKCGWQYEEGDKDWKEPFCCHCGQKLKWFN